MLKVNRHVKYPPPPGKSCISCYFQMFLGELQTPQEHMKTITFDGGGKGLEQI